MSFFPESIRCGRQKLSMMIMPLLSSTFKNSPHNLFLSSPPRIKCGINSSGKPEKIKYLYSPIKSVNDIQTSQGVNF